jgi:N-acetylmuramoyl-L-alanine amidase
LHHPAATARLGAHQSGGIDVPTNALLNRLSAIYAGTAIRYPHLKAVTLAQWLIESGRGTSDLATRHYNFAGLKWRPEMALFATKVMYQAHDGLDAYCKFATLESFVSGYWAFIGRPPYSGWETHVDTAEDYIRFIGPIYTPTPNYADNILALVPEAQALLDTSAIAMTEASVGLTDIGTIILDPGHGGDQKVGGSSPNNAVSVSGVKEKKLTLDFCMILRDQLLAQAAAANQKIQVVLTRTSDVNLGIVDRAAFAGRYKAKALVCLHFNGMADPTIRGAETYYADAAHGNTNVQADMAFAAAVHAGWIAGLRAVLPGTRDRGLKPESDSGPGGLGILRDAALGNPQPTRKCLGAYIEGEFISNPGVDKAFISGPDAIANRTTALAALATVLRAQLASLP